MTSVVLNVILITSGLTALQKVQAGFVTRCPKNLPYTTDMKLFNDRCYQFVSEEKFWSDARRYCNQYGGRLVKIDNSETNAFIVNALSSLWWKNNGVWIGLNDRNKEMQFQWSGHNIFENEPAGGWSNWGRGHPGAFLHSFRDCVRMVREEGQWKWHETPCNSLKWHYRFICEYKAALDNEGIRLALTQNNQVKQLKGESLSTKLSNTSQFQESTKLEEESLSIATTAPMEIVPKFYPLEDTEIAGGKEHTTVKTDLEMQSLQYDDDIEIDEEQINNLVLVEISNATALEAKQEFDESKGSRVGLLLGLALCFVVAAFIILAAFLLYRRKRKQKMANDFEQDTESKSEKSSRPNKLTANAQKTMAVANIYVIDDVMNSSYLREKSSEDKIQMGYDYIPTGNDNEKCSKFTGKEEVSDEDDAMAQYDMPKSSSLYAEIPDDEFITMETDHVYESLEEVVSKIVS